MAAPPLIPPDDPTADSGDTGDDTQDSTAAEGQAQDGATNATSAPQDAAPADDGSGQSPSDQGAPQGDGTQVRPRLIPGTDAQSGDLPAGPQEQQDFDQGLYKCMKFIHGRQTRDEVVKMLHDPSRTVAESVGHAAYYIIMTVSQQKAAVTKEALSESVMEEILQYVVPELMTVGCAAGIFPFEDPDSQNPGEGNTEFDRQVKLACLEATKEYGQKILKSPDAPQRTQEAQEDWAKGVHHEVQNGTADPRYMAYIKANGPGTAANGPAQTPPPDPPEVDNSADTDAPAEDDA